MEDWQLLVIWTGAHLWQVAFGVMAWRRRVESETGGLVVAAVASIGPVVTLVIFGGDVVGEMSSTAAGYLRIVGIHFGEIWLRLWSVLLSVCLTGTGIGLASLMFPPRRGYSMAFRACGLFACGCACAATFVFGPMP